MKNPLRILMILATFAFLTYCGDKEEDVTPDDENNNTTDTTGIDTTKNETPMTSEEHKAYMQDIAVDFVNEISGMNDLQVMDAAVNMGQYVDLSEDEGGRISSSFVTTFNKSLVALGKGKITPLQFGYLPAVVAEDPESLEELFDENTGVFEWNFSTEEFDFTANESGTIVFKFPSDETVDTNDSELTLSNYTSVYISSPIDEDYTGDLPTSLDVSVEIDGTEVMSYGFEVDYNNEGIPESLTTSMSMETYSLSVSLTNTNTKVGQSVEFKNNDLVLIGTSFEANGDFSEDALNSVDESEDPTDVVDNGTFTYTLLDLKITGTIDVAGMWPEVEDVDTYYEPEYDESRPDLEGNAEILEDALKDYASLGMTYVSSGDKAADMEFYTFIDSDSYEWDGVTYTDEWIELGARMVFEDGSKVDVEDFLSTGFDSLEDAINDLISDIEDSWDEDLGDIDFGDL